MKQLKWVSGFLIFCGMIAGAIVMEGCQPIERTARDTAAALSGSLVAAQAQYQGTCQQNPQQLICQTINRGVAAQNALITATETYCGWSVSLAPPDPSAKCVPVKSAQAALTSAIANAKQLTVEVKGVVK